MTARCSSGTRIWASTMRPRIPTPLRVRRRLEEKLPFALTAGQRQAWESVARKLNGGSAMACLLQGETGNRILREVKQYVKGSGIPVYGLKSHEGFWRFLVIRYSRAFDSWMANVVTSEERQEAVRPIVDILSQRVGPIETVVNNINRRKAGIAVGETEMILSGEGYLRDRIGPFTFQISANSLPGHG